MHELDGEIGKLVDGIKDTKLPVDLIVLADHGMAKVEGPPVYLDQYGLNLDSLAPIVGSILYPKSDDDAEKAYEALRGKSDKFVVYRRAQTPAALHLADNPRSVIQSWSQPGRTSSSVRKDPQGQDIRLSGCMVMLPPKCRR